MPGTRFVLEGEANRGEGNVRHQVVFTVTDVTKVIDGVGTVVVWDRDLQPGLVRHLPEPRRDTATEGGPAGHWLVASDGGIFAFGEASFLGPACALHLTKPIVGMAGA